MPITIRVQEKSNAGDAAGGRTSLELPNERTSVREVIRSHVYQSVKDHNVGCAARAARDAGHAPTAERELNTPKRRTPGELDWRKELDRAVEAFRCRRVLLLIDDRQLDELDQPLELTNESVVTFVRLVPLAGG